MKTKLITSLRAAASALEQGRFHYNWHEASRCNCGVLVCALLGLTPGQLSPRIPIGAKEQATWRQRMAAQCPITGQTHHELLKTLFGFGLTQEDMINLEFLRDPNVISRIPRKRVWYKLWLKRRPLYYTEMRDVVVPVQD